jgi:DNA-binding GntR family transcriptional regulator
MASLGQRKKPVSRTTITDQVCEAVREMILSGELKPQQSVTQDELAEMLDVSTMPVREALQRLSYEGLVDAFPGKSYRISTFDRQDLIDIYWTHAVLEGELARRAVAGGDDALVPALEAIHLRWTAPGVSADEFYALNRDFHRLINRAAASPRLLVLLRNTLNFIPRHLYLGLPTWAETSVPGHRAIIDAIAAGDGDKAADAASKHVWETGQLLIDHFDATGYWETARQPRATE